MAVLAFFFLLALITFSLSFDFSFSLPLDAFFWTTFPPVDRLRFFPPLEPLGLGLGVECSGVEIQGLGFLGQHCRVQDQGLRSGFRINIAVGVAVGV